MAKRHMKRRSTSLIIGGGVQSLSHVQHFATPVDCSPPGSSVYGISQARMAVSCYFLLQGIFLDQGLDPCLLHWQVDYLPLSHQRRPSIDSKMAKEDVALVYNGVLHSHGKEPNRAICRDVNEPRDCCTKWSKSERQKQTYINTYM